MLDFGETFSRLSLDMKNDFLMVFCFLQYTSSPILLIYCGMGMGRIISTPRNIPIHSVCLYGALVYVGFCLYDGQITGHWHWTQTNHKKCSFSSTFYCLLIISIFHWRTERQVPTETENFMVHSCLLRKKKIIRYFNILWRWIFGRFRVDLLTSNLQFRVPFTL